MMSFWGAFKVMFITTADTVTMGMIAVNHLARSAAERTAVVEKKSIAAAALSELDSHNTVAIKLKEIHNTTSGISKEELDAADQFIRNYQSQRSIDLLNGTEATAKRSTRVKSKSKK